MEQRLLHIVVENVLKGVRILKWGLKLEEKLRKLIDFRHRNIHTILKILFFIFNTILVDQA